MALLLNTRNADKAIYTCLVSEQYREQLNAQSRIEINQHNTTEKFARVKCIALFPGCSIVHCSGKLSLVLSID